MRENREKAIARSSVRWSLGATAGLLWLIAVFFILVVSRDITSVESVGLKILIGEDERIVVSGDSARDWQGRPLMGSEIQGYLYFDGSFSPVDRRDLHHLPTLLSDFGWNEATHRQKQRLVSEELQSGRLAVVLHTGERVNLPLLAERGTQILPWHYWSLMAIGLACLGLAVVVVAKRGSNIEAFLFAAAAVGVCVIAASVAVNSVREVGWPDALIAKLFLAIRLGELLFFASLAAICWCTPRRLFGGFVVLAILLMGTVGLLCLWLGFDLWVLNIGLLAAAVVGALLQNTSKILRPVDRALGKWLIASLSVGLANGIWVWYLPITLGLPTLPSGCFALVLSASTLLVLSLSLLRFAPATLDTCWVEAPFWLLATLLLVLVDFVLTSAVTLQRPIAFLTASVLVGWLYIPVRRWAQSVLRPRVAHRADSVLSLVLQYVLRTDQDPASNEALGRLLRSVYKPKGLEIRRAIRQDGAARIEQQGAAMVLPVTGGEEMFLQHANRGQSLFSADDLKLAELFVELSFRAAQVISLREQDIREERRRIMRDLHDDVASKLLTLLHSVESERSKDLASRAFHSLREAIYSLDDDSNETLYDLMDDLYSEMMERLEGRGIKFQWYQSDMDDMTALSARSRVNVKRIVQEGLSNILKHSEAAVVRCEFRYHAGMLTATLSNDGIKEDNGVSNLGKGLHNITTRAKELNGAVHWMKTESEGRLWFNLVAEVPIATGSANHAISSLG